MVRADAEIVRQVSLVFDGHIREMLVGKFYTFLGYLITRHLLIPLRIKFLGDALCRAVEEHLHHPVKHPGVVPHHIGDAPCLLLWQAAIALLQNLRETHDDVKRCAYLVGYILDEQRLLPVGLLGQFADARQLFIALGCLVIHLPDILHMARQGVLHHGKAVLYTSDDIPVVRR